MSTSKPDDLEAVRTIADTLQPFPSDDRERVLRWVREKLGMLVGASPSPAALPTGAPHVVVHRTESKAKDIRSFVAEKDPRSMNELAAVVAYFHAFLAPEAERRSSITKDQVVEACRLAERKRPGAPAQVLVNARLAGLLDRVSEGEYRLNAVGENLVAMVLPYAEPGQRPPRRKAKKGASRAAKVASRGRAARARK